MRAREDRGMTREQLGKAVGVSDQTIAGLETIRVHPHHIRRGGWKPSALRLASFFGVAPELFPDSVLAVAESKKTVEVDGRGRREAHASGCDVSVAVVHQHRVRRHRRGDTPRPRAMRRVVAREARARRLYYGLRDEEPHTLNEIGESWPGRRFRRAGEALREAGLAELRRVMKR